MKFLSLTLQPDGLGLNPASTTDKLGNLQPSFNLFMLQGFFICSSGDDTLMGLKVFMRIK